MKAKIAKVTPSPEDDKKFKTFAYSILVNIKCAN